MKKCYKQYSRNLGRLLGLYQIDVPRALEHLEHGPELLRSIIEHVQDIELVLSTEDGTPNPCIKHIRNQLYQLKILQTQLHQALLTTSIDTS